MIDLRHGERAPFTTKGEAPIDLWAQREYVACTKKSVGFSAHGLVWHYLMYPERITIKVGADGSAKLIERATVRKGFDWLEEARQSMLSKGVF